MAAGFYSWDLEFGLERYRWCYGVLSCFSAKASSLSHASETTHGHCPLAPQAVRLSAIVSCQNWGASLAPRLSLSTRGVLPNFQISGQYSPAPACRGASAKSSVPPLREARAPLLFCGICQHLCPRFTIYWGFVKRNMYKLAVASSRSFWWDPCGCG